MISILKGVTCRKGMKMIYLPLGLLQARCSPPKHHQSSRVRINVDWNDGWIEHGPWQKGWPLWYGIL